MLFLCGTSALHLCFWCCLLLCCCCLLTSWHVLFVLCSFVCKPSAERQQINPSHRPTLCLISPSPFPFSPSLPPSLVMLLLSPDFLTCLVCITALCSFVCKPPAERQQINHSHTPPLRCISPSPLLFSFYVPLPLDFRLSKCYSLFLPVWASSSCWSPFSHQSPAHRVSASTGSTCRQRGPSLSTQNQFSSTLERPQSGPCKSTAQSEATVHPPHATFWFSSMLFRAYNCELASPKLSMY